MKDSTGKRLDSIEVPEVSKAGREKLLTQNAVALQRWRSGLANREYAPANTVVLSDSIGEGQGATQYSRTWRQLLLKRLRERFPVSGVVGGRGFIGAVKTGFTSGTWPVVSAGSPTIDVNFGPKRQCAMLTTAGQSLTFTLQGTSVDLMYVRSTATGTISYTIDGGSAVTFNTAGGTANNQGGQVTRINLGTSGAHTLVVSYSSGGTCYIEGVVEYDGDENKGIRVHDAGHHGWKSSDWANRNGFDYWMQSIKTLAPDLLIYTVGVNDVTAGVTADQWLTNTQNILGYVRGVGSDPSVLVVPMFQRSETTPSVWANYVKNAYTLAASDPKIAICDISVRMPAVGLTGNGSLGLYADTVHPNDKGHSMMADLVMGTIVPN
jgi:lysophospholipase L1-like esterase